MAKVTDKPSPTPPGAPESAIGPDVMAWAAKTSALKLVAKDEKDLKVISAVLQDALIPLVDLRYEKFEQRVIGVFNRFCWERQPIDPDPADPEAPDTPLYHRVLCGLHVSGVTQVQTRAIDTANRDRPLAVLALMTVDGGMELTFSGGGAIRLQAAALDLALGDIGEPWVTPFRPDHPDTAADDAADDEARHPGGDRAGHV